MNPLLAELEDRIRPVHLFVAGGVLFFLLMVLLALMPRAADERVQALQTAQPGGVTVVVAAHMGMPSALLRLYGVPHTVRAIGSSSELEELLREHWGTVPRRATYPLVLVDGELWKAREFFGVMERMPPPNLIAASQPVVYGSSGCGHTTRLLEQLDSSGVAHRFRDVRAQPWSDDEEAHFWVRGIRDSYGYPLVDVGGELLERPSARTVARLAI
jgi:hypothetical protein